MYSQVKTCGIIAHKYMFYDSGTCAMKSCTIAVLGLSISPFACNNTRTMISLHEISCQRF